MGRALRQTGTTSRLILGSVPQVSEDTLRIPLSFAKPSSFAQTLYRVTDLTPTMA